MRPRRNAEVFAGEAYMNCHVVACRWMPAPSNKLDSAKPRRAATGYAAGFFNTSAASRATAEANIHSIRHVCTDCHSSMVSAR